MPGFPIEQNVLALVDVLAARQFVDQHLVDRGPGGEVERVERLDGRKARRLQPPLGRPLLTVEQFEFEQLEEVAEMVDVVGGTPRRNLLALGRHRRQA